jgi:hypothetical protein
MRMPTAPFVSIPAVIFAAFVAACSSVQPLPHQSLTAGAEPLRSQFNRDAGRTRILMIAAPT